MLIDYNEPMYTGLEMRAALLEVRTETLQRVVQAVCHYCRPSEVWGQAEKVHDYQWTHYKKDGNAAYQCVATPIFRMLDKEKS